MLTDFTSIKSVAYQLGELVSSTELPQSRVLEWLSHAYLQISSRTPLNQKVVKLSVKDYQAQMTKFKYITHVVFVKDNCVESVQPTSNPFHKTICTYDLLVGCPECAKTFSLSPTGVFTFNFEAGEVWVAYTVYPTDDEGYFLIPNIDILKEALETYVLYKYWQRRDLTKEEGAFQRMREYRQLWSTLAQRAAGLINLPSEPELENLRVMMTRLAPKNTRYRNLFSNLTTM